MELKSKFEQAAADSKQLSKKPDNDTLLKLYALYKQSTIGDINEAPPANMFDFVAKAKYNAWNEIKGKSADEAMAEYVELVEQLKKSA
jgi:diazepam-binding inhibitor (GABA receptor modulating acyl-CoA-binding protein)